MVAEGALHADITRTINPLGQTVKANRFFLELGSKAVKTPADIENLPGSYSPLDQPVTAEIRSVNQNGHVRYGKYPCWGPKKLFSQPVHVFTLNRCSHQVTISVKDTAFSAGSQHIFRK